MVYLLMPVHGRFLHGYKGNAAFSFMCHGNAD